MTKVLIGDITGPAGPQGPEGPEGPQGERGLDGANVLPTSEAVAQAVTEEGPAKDALSATIDERGAKRFSRGDQSYNITTSALRRWRTALAGSEQMANGTQRSARVLCGWNSIVQGAGLNSIGATFPSQMAAMFAREFPAAGTGIVHMNTQSWFRQDGANAIDTRVNRIGAWATAARAAFAAGTIRATGTDKKLTFTETGVEFVVYFARDADGGVMTVDVDGGATAEIDCSGSGLGSHTIINTIATGTGGTALTDTSHTITITAPASGYAYVTGVEARRGKTGVRVTRAAMSGSTTNSLLGTEESMEAVFDQAEPDLSVLLELVNDWLNADLAVATFKTRWATIIQRAQQTGDVLIVVPPISDEAGTYPFEDYVEALYELADEYDCALVDIHARWSAYAEADAAGLMGDAYHPSFKGYRDIARAVYEIIGTKAPGTTVSASATLGAQTFTGRQTFGAGLTVAAGQTIIMGETTISRASAFSLSVAGFWAAQRLFANQATNLAAMNAKGQAGVRAVSAQGADGTERGGFSQNGRLYAPTYDRQATVGDAGAASALPATPSTYIKVEDQSGNIHVIPAYAAS